MEAAETEERRQDLERADGRPDFCKPGLSECVSDGGPHPRRRTREGRNWQRCRGRPLCSDSRGTLRGTRRRGHTICRSAGQAGSSLGTGCPLDQSERGEGGVREEIRRRPLECLRRRTLLGERSRAAGRWEKNVGPAVAARADKAGHVFDDANDTDADLAAKVELLADVLERDLLRRRHEHGAVDPALAEVLDDREVLVRRPWRRVND